MERTKNTRASRRPQSTGIVIEVNQLIQSEHFGISTLHVLHSRLKTVKAELVALNAELETFMTAGGQVAEDYNSVMENEDVATSVLALLEHHMDRLKVFRRLRWRIRLPPLMGTHQRPQIENLRGLSILQIR
ncbi:hypothetical protein HPB52_013694 [Rhipicephalus sanguineus]|uniref:Uncharacterized protein n=1 Tax=Rhipicephalus sanguineus TaxID=34632 RepID=A0A9D4SQU4_RHISA|nr:hypothetical protein HPB52_013694 [Rhipicephalus sanguineus]